MTAPAERHAEQLLASAYDDSRHRRAGAMAFLGRLLNHFDEHEPKVALAIREGIPDSVPMDAIRYGLSQEKLDDATAMSLNFYSLDDIVARPETGE